ncbi:hypothetical protein SPRG_14904 [Saprolegnia parasitica CBS 223.65]|uniref:Uncharacterized protein n=1 Tax=Saprolegnia parasitica (strain CBS 223.65) TaxID=695850 RepID=A0A067BNQ5_SAPPC|nr:hypothetical protein SPRG_14904 [Saprolegnia parasitica CBS 223.65]KDO19873.1 hypothetical protein SPRG_14904 [Saprolegnia parasitica CBS 223.65]|eukprot:XP_012209430.1 hypothetical protein SPRG_14904 [Saprolegnia parasitica CBS 223.65]
MAFQLGEPHAQKVVWTRANIGKALKKTKPTPPGIDLFAPDETAPPPVASINKYTDKVIALGGALSPVHYQIGRRKPPFQPSSADPDSAFSHVPTLTGNPWAVWKVTNTGNGKLALKPIPGANWRAATAVPRAPLDVR